LNTKNYYTNEKSKTKSVHAFYLFSLICLQKAS
jgi:hypothetical protein